MRNKITKAIMGLAALAALALGGSAIAGAASDGDGAAGERRGGSLMGFGGRGDERPLTGANAAKVKAAALARVPGGTVVRTETDDGGIYEAHVRKPDGSEVEVKVDRQFKVTGVEEHAGRGGGRGHGPGGRGDERPLTGDNAAKAKAAALAKVPGGTVLRTETDGEGGGYEAHVRKSDGTEVEVKLDRQFKVTGVEQHDRPER